MQIPHVKLSNKGPTLHFSHANGYPPMSYRELLTPFSEDNKVVASLHRPLWEQSQDPNSLRSWEVLGDDVLSLVAELETPVVSVGHSMGSAAVLMAAAQKPEYFRKIVLIEPVLVPRLATLLLHLFPGMAKRRWPLARQTLHRTDRWKSKGAAFSHFRPKGVFERISDDVLWDYINAGLKIDSRGEYELAFTKEWELQCYLTVYNCWRFFLSLEVPLLVIRGSESNTLSKRAWDKLKQMAPHNDYLEVNDSGHLVPFERPRALVSLIQEWIKV